MEEGKKNKLIIVISILLIVIITLAIIIPKFPIFVVKRTFNYAVYHIVNVSGLSPWLVKGILVFALMPFYWALLEISKIISRRKKLAKFIILGYSGLFFLTMFFVSRDTYFQMYDGAPSKYYALTPEGIRFFDSPGYDPKYGIKLQPVTPEIIEKYKKKQLGLIPNKIDISSPETYEFFDKLTGEPKVWYYLDQDGKFEFFDGPGFHPVYREELKPVTKEIIASFIKKLKEQTQLIEAQKKEEQKKKQMEIIGSLINKSVQNQKDLIDSSVLILDQNKQEDTYIKNKIADLLKEKGASVKDIFKPNFIRENIFENIYSGQTNIINSLNLSEQTDYIIFGKKNVSFEQNQDYEGLITARINLELKLFASRDGNMVSSSIFTGVGAGFSKDEAEIKAADSMSDKIKAFLDKFF